jgi:hypothetical protein
MILPMIFIVMKLFFLRRNARRDFQEWVEEKYFKHAVFISNSFSKFNREFNFFFEFFFCGSSARISPMLSRLKNDLNPAQRNKYRADNGFLKECTIPGGRAVTPQAENPGEAAARK